MFAALMGQLTDDDDDDDDGTEHDQVRLLLWSFLLFFFSSFLLFRRGCGARAGFISWAPNSGHVEAFVLCFLLSSFISHLSSLFSLLSSRSLTIVRFFFLSFLLVFFFFFFFSPMFSLFSLSPFSLALCSLSLSCSLCSPSIHRV